MFVYIAIIFALVTSINCQYTSNRIRTTITVNENENVTLPCINPPFKNISDIIWIHSFGLNLIPIYTANLKYDFCKNKCVLNTTTENQIDLILVNVTKNQSGVYICKLDDNRVHGSGELYEYTLYVGFELPLISIKNNTLNNSLNYGRKNTYNYILIVLILIFTCINV